MINPCLIADHFSISGLEKVPEHTHVLHTIDSWTHAAFTVNASPVVAALCGEVAYTASFGHLSEYGSYNPASRTFHLSGVEDVALVAGSPYTYTVTAELVAFPGSHTTLSAGKISLVDPCEMPEEFTVGVPINDGSNYVDPAIWSFPTFHVTPAHCSESAVFTCGYIDGPVIDIDIDMCGCDHWNGNYHTEIIFDMFTGGLVFDTDDFETFPPGTYTFEITITIGISVEVKTVEIILQNTC
jgi:hypothetical protein